MFTKEFKNYRNGKEQLERVRVKRAHRVKYFTSKIEFRLIEEFAEKDINFICNCYDHLCKLHRPDIGLTEQQVRILKIKTGIVLWMLAYINEIIKGIR